MRIVITGANRGIGLELTRQLLARGDAVVATARQPESAHALRELAAEHSALQLVALDISLDESARGLAQRVPPGAIDGLINNAGITGNAGSFGGLDFQDMLETYGTNALGTLRVTQALWPRLKNGTHKRVLNVSTGMGSIADNGSGGAWGYRMSKAALNMATKNLALALSSEGIACVAVNPGWVQTDMGGTGATMSVEESARRLIGIFDALDPTKSGQFLNYDGQIFPW